MTREETSGDCDRRLEFERTRDMCSLIRYPTGYLGQSLFSLLNNMPKNVLEEWNVKEVMQTEKSPATFGLYSQAIKANNLLFPFYRHKVVKQLRLYARKKVESEKVQEEEKFVWMEMTIGDGIE
ncbi:hypothetical protein LguiB_031163 [Lonicera macranthoides]